ncbi:hypothetical protein ACLKA7_016077 [Drosophila subpalustris]
MQEFITARQRHHPQSGQIKGEKQLQRAIQFDYLHHKYRKRQSIEAPQQQPPLSPLHRAVSSQLQSSTCNDGDEDDDDDGDDDDDEDEDVNEKEHEKDKQLEQENGNVDDDTIAKSAAQLA